MGEKIYSKMYLLSRATRFFYKQHFYKQRQAELGKKLSKN